MPGNWSTIWEALQNLYFTSLYISKLEKNKFLPKDFPGQVGKITTWSSRLTLSPIWWSPSIALVLFTFQSQAPQSRLLMHLYKIQQSALWTSNPKILTWFYQEQMISRQEQISQHQDRQALQLSHWRLQEHYLKELWINVKNVYSYYNHEWLHIHPKQSSTCISVSKKWTNTVLCTKTVKGYLISIEWKNSTICGLEGRSRSLLRWI